MVEERRVAGLTTTTVGALERVHGLEEVRRHDHLGGRVLVPVASTTRTDSRREMVDMRVGPVSEGDQEVEVGIGGINRRRIPRWRNLARNTQLIIPVDGAQIVTGRSANARSPLTLHVTMNLLHDITLTVVATSLMITMKGRGNTGARDPPPKSQTKILTMTRGPHVAVQGHPQSNPNQ